MSANFEKFVWTGIAASIAVCIGTAPLAAGSNGPKPTQAKPQTHATTMTHGQSGATTHGQSGATTHGQSGATTHGKSATTTTTHGNSAKATTTTSHGNSKKSTTTTTATTAKGNSKKSTTTTAGGTTTTTGGTTDTTGGTTTGTTSGTVTPTSDMTTLSKAQRLLAKNTNLANKLSTQLGIPAGPDAATTLSQYAAGFKNLGQFVAATNVSTNQNIPFEQLKAAMTGYGIDGKPIEAAPGTEPTKLLSLGQAIQKLGGTDSTTATEAAKTATTQANTTITSSNTTTTTTTTTGKTKKH